MTFVVGDVVRFRRNPERAVDVDAILGRDCVTEDVITEVRWYPCHSDWWGYTLASGRRALGCRLELVRRRR